MYHCHVHFYLAGHTCEIFEIIKTMSPLEHFSHEFSESDIGDTTLTAEADVILVNLQDRDEKEALQLLTAGKKDDAELIVLADKDQTAHLSEYLTMIKDIWTTPLSDEEIRFRFLRWQQSYKMSKDFWQTSHYFESTINNIPNLIWYKDKDGIHKKVNDSFCKTVNKTKSQVEGRGHAYIWDVDYDDPACIESEHEVMSRKKTCISEEIIKTGDGMRTLTTYKSPLFNLDGSVMGTVGVAIDITQERAYEQDLIEKNHTLEMVFKTMDCGVICHTMDGSHILSINRAALKILGYESQEELVAQGFNMVADSVMDEDKPKLRERIGKLQKEGDNVSLEYRVQHKNGDILHIMGNVKLIEENGQLFYQRFLIDCTTQKLQEKKKQQESVKRQMELIHALSIDYHLVYFFNLETGMGIPLRIGDNELPVSDSVLNENISLKESMERYIEESVYEDDKELLRQASSQSTLKKELAGKNLYYTNYRIAEKDGIKYYQMKVVRTGTQEDNQGIVIGFRSVDEEIRSEMEKKSLLEDALYQANKANKAKSVFLSNMSHDIRTPMNAIVGFTNLAITHLDEKEQVKEYLRKIESSGNHLISLINDVLDMSRIESGKIHLEEEACSLSDILHNLHNILLADVQAKHLKLDIEAVDITDEEIYCDRLRLNQVLLNLLSNSIKYTNKGGTVSVSLKEKPNAPSGYANFEFYIKDTGIGMSEDFLQHIFEPFERERNSTISKIQGTGLGMAITKNIVDMMNGSIEVKSKQGVGTEFIISFTFRLNSKVEKLSAISEFEHGRALVVADSQETGNNISHMLQKLGMYTECAMSGEDAIQHTCKASADNENYCIYVIDALLSDMTGIELTQRIQQKTGNDAPLIIMAAYDWSDIESEARKAGVTTFCSKPLFLSELQHCILSAIHTDAKHEKNKAKKSMPLRTGRILLAEDIDLNQEIAVTILNEAGFQTEVADNGQIAVDMVKNSEPGHYQLVLMDIQMPVMNGYEATKSIRELENKELASIPILAMSANAFEEDKQEALKCGMNGHIAKPIDVKALFHTLDEILA